MPRPKPLPIDPPPGFVKTEAPLTAMGRFIDGQWVRFANRKAEKIGGWVRYTTTPFPGIARALHAWNDLTSRTWVAIGSTRKLMALGGTRDPINITPQLTPEELTDAISTTSGSATVTIAITAHGMTVDQGFTLTNFDAVGGLDVNGAWFVASTPDNNTITFTHTSAATSTVSGGGGTGDLTPDLQPLRPQPSQGFGFGTGAYGTGTWGTARSSAVVTFDAGYWMLENFGKILLAAPFGGRLYSWDPTDSPVPRATAVNDAEAPGSMRGFFVTPERFVIAFGASPDTNPGNDDLLLRWCSQGDYEDWAPSVTNTAGDRRLTIGKRILAGTAFAGGASLVWTDVALYLHQFTGSRFVFDTRPVGRNCGIDGPMAHCVAGNRAYWKGPGGFFAYGGTVEPIPNSQDIFDYIKARQRAYFETKTCCFYNMLFNEVWWLYVPNGQDEPTEYVAVSLDDFSWITGTLSRTAATRLEGYNTVPILAGLDGHLYEHETGLDGDGAEIPWHIETAPIEIADGDSWLEIQGFIPSFQRHVGNVALSITAKDREMDAASIDAETYTVAPGQGVVDAWISGRLLAFRMSGSGVGCDFRMGKPKLIATSSGVRP